MIVYGSVLLLLVGVKVWIWSGIFSKITKFEQNGNLYTN